MPPPLQISIPQTSTASDGTKPYTIYHISLTLPLRVHVLQKRYSDFTTLHASLTSSTGSAPPLPLPPKSWLRSTVSSSSLVSERRAGLESYLRAILDSPDPRWRQSPVWRTFLSLPSNMLSTPASAPVAADTLDPPSWLALHRETKDHIHSARLALRKRETASVPADAHAAAAEAKGSLLRAAAGISRCDTALRSATQSWGADVGDGELRRRKDMLVAARGEVEALETQMRSFQSSSREMDAGATGAGVPASERDKAGLFEGSTVRTGRVLGGPAKETERTRELDNSGVLQLQQQVMQEQEEDVLALGKAVGRMREMGIQINEELVVQNQMLGLLEGDVDRVQGKLDVGKKRMAKIR